MSSSNGFLDAPAAHSDTQNENRGRSPFGTLDRNPQNSLNFNAAGTGFLPQNGNGTAYVNAPSNHPHHSNVNAAGTGFIHQNRNENGDSTAYGNAASDHQNNSNLNAAGTSFVPQIGNGVFRNVHVPFINHNSDAAPPNFDMLSSTGNSGENIVSNPQVLLMQAYAQLNEAIMGRQQALACYQEHITRHEAQVFALKDQIDTLKDELRMARADAETLRLSGTRLSQPSEVLTRATSTVATLGPSDSVSHTPEDLPQGPEQPAERPEEYPAEILWTYEDAKNDPVVCTKTNKSRPTMEKALRNEDGTMISHAAWVLIKDTARRAIGTHLTKLNAEKLSKKHFRTHHTVAWSKAIAFLEVARPLVGLCAGHWKAEHVISTMLTADRSTQTRAEKRARSGADEEGGEHFDFDKVDDEGSDDDDNDDDEGAKLAGKKRSAPPSEEVPAATKKTKTQNKSKPLATEKGGPRTVSQVKEKKKTQRQLDKQAQKSPTPAVSLENQLNRPHSDPQNTPNMLDNPNAGGASGASPTANVDISFIRVKADFATLRRELGQVQAPIPDAVALLDAMAASPNFKSSEPSNEVAAFLKRIEAADPNSSEIGEDDSNQSWGHWQFTAGNMTITTVLKNWACIGNVEMACKLLAATIRTCKVARHICHERNITASGFLSDAYLNNIVAKLWESWNAAGGNIAEKTPKSKSKSNPLPAPNNGPSNTTPGPAGTEDSSAIQELMKPLQVVDLKTWIDSHNISTTLKNKKDLVKFIIDNPTLPIPSAEEISEIIAARKTKPSSKATK